MVLLWKITQEAQETPDGIPLFGWEVEARNEDVVLTKIKVVVLVAS
jgi:hypothetical protein